MNETKFYRYSYLLVLILFLNAEDIQPIIKVGYDIGLGNRLVSVQDIDNKISTINGGDGLNLDMGLSLDLMKNFEIQSFIGYKYESFDKDQSERLSNLQVSSFLLFKSIKWKIGIGGSYQIKPELVIEESIYQFQNVFAGILQFEYVINNFISIGVKTTMVDYTFVDKSIKKSVTNANSLGVFLSFILPSS